MRASAYFLCSVAVLILILSAHHEVSALPVPCEFLKHMMPTMPAVTTPAPPTTAPKSEKIKEVTSKFVEFMIVKMPSEGNPSETSQTEIVKTAPTAKSNPTPTPNPIEELISNYIKLITYIFSLP